MAIYPDRSQAWFLVKFGTLQYSTVPETTDPAVRETYAGRINQAEAESAATCEVCSRDGGLSRARRHDVRTLCQEHRDALTAETGEEWVPWRPYEALSAPSDLERVDRPYVPVPIDEVTMADKHLGEVEGLFDPLRYAEGRLAAQREREEAPPLTSGVWRLTTEHGSRIYIDVDRQRWGRLAAPIRTVDPLDGRWVRLGYGPYVMPPRQEGRGYEIPDPHLVEPSGVRVGESVVLGRAMVEHHYSSVVARVERVGDDESSLGANERAALRDE